MSMRMVTYLQAAWLGIALLAFPFQPALSYTDAVKSREAPLAIHVSMFQLLGQPEKFNGKKIIVDGVIDFGLSQSSLFASQEWYKFGVLKNALVIRLDPSSNSVDHFIGLSGKYVLVEGVFSAKDCGELCQYMGSIHDIDTVKVIGDASH